ncbi:hypothetical protein [Achromobacter sp. AGC39]
MAARTIFFLPAGDVCSRAQVQDVLDTAKAEDRPDPYVHDQYDCGKWKAKLSTSTFLIVNNGVPAAHWKPFEVDVVNRITTDYEGHKLPKPIETPDTSATKSFRTLEEATAYYQDFLLQNGGAKISKSGELVVKGNLLAASGDAPQVDEDDPEAATVGCW